MRLLEKRESLVRLVLLITIGFEDAEEISDDAYNIYYSNKGMIQFYLDFGVQTLTDENGNQVGSYHSWMKYELVDTNVN